MLLKRQLSRRNIIPVWFLIFALNYGGRAEIVSAVQAIAKEVEAGKLSPEAIR